jgi:transcriptional regulator with XRE-family HTH domain
MDEDLIYQKRLVEMKNACNLSVVEISEKSGVSKSTVSRIVSGQCEGTSIQNISDVVTAMGFSMHNLFNPTNSKKDENLGFYEKALDMANCCNEYLRIDNAYLKKMLHRLLIACAALVSVFVFIVLYDILNSNVGWIRY